MTHPQYGKPETWPRIPEPVEWHIYAVGPQAIRRLGLLPRYEVLVPDKVPGIVWPRVVWGYERAQRILAAGH